MKVLIVFSKTQGITSPFILEQINSLKKIGIEIECFSITKKGVLGYLGHYSDLKKIINEFKPNIIHAHYGLSGLFANLQRSVPVITTFHGSDVYIKTNRRLSKISHFLSYRSIFVSNKLKKRLNVKKGHIITCGVDFSIFYDRYKLKQREKFILFSGSSSKWVKNYPLALESVTLFNSRNNESIKLVELTHLSRDEVAILLSKASALLITSFFEGSSQVLKEAMACNCPVIAVDVGSVSDLICADSKAGVIVDYNAIEISEKIKQVINSNFFNGSQEIKNHNISLQEIAQKLVKVYNEVIIDFDGPR